MTDTISFAEYKRDMEQITRAATEALNVKERENINLRRVIWAIIEQSGGRVVVTTRTLARMTPHDMLHSFFDPASGGHVWLSRNPEQATGGSVVMTVDTLSSK